MCFLVHAAYSFDMFFDFNMASASGCGLGCRPLWLVELLRVLLDPGGQTDTCYNIPSQSDLDNIQSLSDLDNIQSHSDFDVKLHD